MTEPDPVTTGIRDLDRLVPSLDPGDLIVVSGDVSHGKTTIALVIALNNLRAKRETLILSTETASAALLRRMGCLEAGIDMARLDAGRATEGEWSHATAAMEALANESPLITAEQWPDESGLLLTFAEALDTAGRLALVVVDCLQFVRPAAGAESREREIAGVARSLKALARQYEVPIVATCGLDRRVERPDRRPLLGDLWPGLQSLADVVLFVHRPDLSHGSKSEKPGVAEIIVAKNRRGGVPQVAEVAFRPEGHGIVDLGLFRRAAADA